MATTGPRLPPLAPGEWGEVLTQLLQHSPGGTDEPMYIFTTLGRADPDLFRRWLGFGGALLDGSLPGRLRELVIVRTAARFGGRYEWAQHLPLAEVQGVTAAELSALSDATPGTDMGTAASVSASAASASASPSAASASAASAAWDALDWSPLERAALRAVDETADGGAVSDVTWEELADLLRESELIELLMLIGHYQMLTGVLRSLRLPLEPRAQAQARLVPGGPAA